MINDTQSAREETIAILNKLGLYNEFLSSETMQAYHELFHSLQNRGKVMILDDNIHTFEVQIGKCSKEQAEQILRERLGYDEDYGFEYSLNW